MGVEASKPTNGGGGGNNDNNKVNFKANDKPIIMILGTQAFPTNSITKRKGVTYIVL